MSNAEDLLKWTLEKSKYEMIDGKIVSKRYVKEGDIVFMRHITLHVTDKEWDKLQKFMDMEGLKYE